MIASDDQGIAANYNGSDKFPSLLQAETVHCIPTGNSCYITKELLRIGLCLLHLPVTMARPHPQFMSILS